MFTVISSYPRIPIIYKNFLQNLSHQNFPFPWTMMLQITQKPSTGKVYQKLIRSCKHFFIKNPIIVTEFLDFCNSSGCSFKGPSFCFKYFKDVPHRIWITTELRNKYNPARNSITKLIPRIYRCDITILKLEYQILSYNETKYLASNVQEFDLRWTTVKYDDGSVVPFEAIIGLFPKLCKFCCYFDKTFPNISKDTVTNFIEVPYFRKLKYFQLHYAPECFDIQKFYNYHKIRKSQTIAYIAFWGQYSPQYINLLTTIADDIRQNYSEMAPIYLDTEEMPREKSLYKIYNARLKDFSTEKL